MLLSSEEVADKLGLALSTIRVYTQRYGVGRKKAGRWFFTAKDVRILENRKAGRE